MRTRMTNAVILMVALMIVGGIGQRANGQSVALHQPTAEEYIDGLLAFLPPYTSFVHPFGDAINKTIFARYPDLDQVNSVQLFALDEQLGIQDGYYGNRDQWNQSIIAAWLRENRPDLSMINEIRFADFEITVIPRDFDADGHDEYIFDIVRGADEPIDREICDYAADYIDYLVVKPTEDGYRLIDPPLGWFGRPEHGVGSFRLGQGGAVEREFADINADGLPEWILNTAEGIGGGPLTEYWRVGGLYILGWRNGELVELTPPFEWSQLDKILYYEERDGGCRSSSFTVTWDILDTDGDPALEIAQSQRYIDNWYCERIVTKHFDWDDTADRYTFSGSGERHPETRNCIQRDAEEAMWAGDIEGAIILYERALTRPSYYIPDDMSDSSRSWRERDLTALDQYLRARLALAYLLVGRVGNAHALLTTLQTETLDSGLTATAAFVDVLIAADGNPRRACLDAFTLYASVEFSHRLGVTVEDTKDDLFPAYLPERSGCDPTPYIEHALQAPFPTNRSPIEMLDERGLDTRHVWQLDLNDDGNREYLIWLAVPVPPIFFAPVGDMYHVSRPTVDPYLQAMTREIWQLPNGTIQGIAIFSRNLLLGFAPWIGRYDPLWGSVGAYTGEGCAEQTPDWRLLWMWRFDGRQLIPLFEGEEICHTTVSSLFPNSEQRIDGGQWTRHDMNTHELLATYRVWYEWDVITQSFIRRTDAPPTPTYPPTSTPIPTPDPTEQANTSERSCASDYEAYLEDRAAYAGLEEAWVYSLQYQHAFELEQRGCIEESTREYVRLYETTVDPAWRALAALHLNGLED